jgi:hypothetical protein
VGLWWEMRKVRALQVSLWAWPLLRVTMWPRGRHTLTFGGLSGNCIEVEMMGGRLSV